MKSILAAERGLEYYHCLHFFFFFFFSFFLFFFSLVRLFFSRHVLWTLLFQNLLFVLYSDICACRRETDGEGGESGSPRCGFWCGSSASGSVVSCHRCVTQSVQLHCAPAPPPPPPHSVKKIMRMKYFCNANL